MYSFALFYIQNQQKFHSQKYLDQIIFPNDDIGGFKRGSISCMYSNLRVI